jgi:hypothetical protein
MLKLNYEDRYIEVHFDHKWLAPFEIDGLIGRSFDENRRCSLATVYVDGRVVGSGVSVCHPTDNFCRASGRKTALTYAVHTLNKPLRKAIWEAYIANCGL